MSILASGLGPFTPPKEYRGEQDQETSENFGTKEVEIMPGEVVDLFFKVENGGDYSGEEIKNKGEEAFNQVKSEYPIKLLGIEYQNNNKILRIRVESTEQKQTESSGKYQTASFTLGFSIATIAFLLIDLLQGISLTFQGSRKVSESGGMLGNINNILSKLIALAIVGYIFINFSDWGE